MKHRNFFGRVLMALLLIALLGGVALGVWNAAEQSRESELRQAYESLRRALVTCYAIEGRYPPDYEYCKEHYGVRIDETKYHVVYTLFAENLMPDVTILVH